MSSLNKVTLIGNLGKDPEIRTTQDGREIASFSIATSETWKDKNTKEKKEKTEWHNIVVFNKGMVSVVKEYLKKGMKVYIEGALCTSKWEDDKGNVRYKTEIFLQGYQASLKMLTSNKSSTSPDNSYSSDNIQAIENEFEDEIPF